MKASRSAPRNHTATGCLEGASEFEDDEEDPDGWDEDRIFDESCVRHVLSSGGGKFILEDFRWETSIAT